MSHLFLCQTESVTDPALLTRYERLLDDGERVRLNRFHFARDAHSFLVSHALMRTALSQFADTAPQHWRFETNAFGRPEIALASGATPLRFNLSHCRGLAACLIDETEDCGVDVEEMRPGSDWTSIAGNYFSPQEVLDLNKLAPGDPGMARFFSLWTLKESYIKARGMGLSLPLDKFTFRLPGKQIDIEFEPELKQNARDWSFTLRMPTASHFLATSVKRDPRRSSSSIAGHWFVPLVGVGGPIESELTAASA